MDIVALGGRSVAAGTAVVLFLLHYAVTPILGGTGIALAVTGSQKVPLRDIRGVRTFGRAGCR